MRPSKLKGVAPVANPDQLYPSYQMISTVLDELGIPKDFESDGPIRYGHRRTAGEDIYFVSNTTDQAVQVNCDFRVGRGNPQLWDAVTGDRRQLSQFRHRGKTTSIPLEFEPYQSFFVVFSRDESESVAAQPSNRGDNFPSEENVATLGGDWELRFDPERGGPSRIQFEELEDWTGRSESGIRYYSGAAFYKKPSTMKATEATKRAASIWT